MKIPIEQAIRQKLMINFEGLHAPDALLASLRRQPVGGVTLFRRPNIQNPSQVRELTATLQRAAREGGQPLLIGADQEGGQLMAIGEGATPFPGNMALGATGSAELAFQAGYANGRELAAMGINVNYAPVCDVNLNLANPVVGTRSFGEDPEQVARLCAVTVAGIQAAGVAATAKHFPGHGDTQSDSHDEVPIIQHGPDHLMQVDLPPFAAAIQAGARLVMTGHVALPALEGGRVLPATLSPAILRGLLRGELGFQGLIISDAMDMGAIQQGPGLWIDALAATAAGVDMLLLNHGPQELEDVFQALLQGARRGLIPEEEIQASAGRVQELKAWLESVEQPPLETVGCAEHQALAVEIASRAVTLVRDRALRLPLSATTEARLAVILPAPLDLTPADTSSYVSHSLAQALRRYQSSVDEWIIPMNPDEAEVAALQEQAGRYDLVIAGTINALQHAGQAALVNALLERGIPTLAVALRMPYDLLAYPTAPTYVCTYSLLPPAMEALAKALFGMIPFAGRLPVSIPNVVGSQ